MTISGFNKFRTLILFFISVLLILCCLPANKLYAQVCYPGLIGPATHHSVDPPIFRWTHVYPDSAYSAIPAVLHFVPKFFPGD